MIKNKALSVLLSLLLILSLLLTGCGNTAGGAIGGNTGGGHTVGRDNIPSANGADSIYITVNNNIPYFTEDEITVSAFETYAQLDALGRCGTAFACIGEELMPTEDRDFSLSSVSPSGWMYNGVSNNNVYPTEIVSGGYIYNRCHLIGFQLTAETTNKQNLITGTKDFNIKGMLPFENMVADFIKETGYHVMYRVTPLFDGNNLLCDGVLLEAYSVEDEGDGIEMCVFIYNIQPGVEIDYYTGENRLEGTGDILEDDVELIGDYIINTKSKKVHLASCSIGQKLTGENREDFNGTLTELLQYYPEYTQCGTCKAFNQ